MLVILQEGTNVEPRKFMGQSLWRAVFLEFTNKSVTSTRDREIPAACLLQVKHKLCYLILNTVLRVMDDCAHFMYVELRDGRVSQHSFIYPQNRNWRFAQIHAASKVQSPNPTLSLRDCPLNPCVFLHVRLLHKMWYVFSKMLSNDFLPPDICICVEFPPFGYGLALEMNRKWQK